MAHVGVIPGMTRSRGVRLLLTVGLGLSTAGAQDTVAVRVGDVLRVVRAPALLPAGQARVRRVTADSVWLRVRPYGETFGFAAREVTPAEVRRHRDGIWRRRLLWTSVSAGLGAGLGALLVHQTRCRRGPIEPGVIDLSCDTPEPSIRLGLAVGGGVGGLLGPVAHWAWERPRWFPGALRAESMSGRPIRAAFPVSGGAGPLYVPDA